MRWVGVVKALVRWLFRLAYQVEVTGWDNYQKAGDRAVIVANHPSSVDGALLAAFLPETLVFAVNTFYFRKWWLQPAFLLFDLLPLDPTNPMAIKRLVQVVKQGRKCVIFPEGRTTVTGALMKIYEGPGMIADLAGASILPIRIEGAQFTRYTHLKGKLRQRWFPKITMTILEPRQFDVPKDIKGERRRQIIGAWLYDVMSDMTFETGDDLRRTLFKSLTDARALHGGQHLVAEDIERKPVNYNRLISGSLILGRKLSRNTRAGEYVGVLLPNSVSAVTTFFALQAYGRVPAMLNFSTGLKDMLSACKTAHLRTVLTSRLFIAAAKFEETVKALGQHAEVVYLEDVRESIDLFDKLFGLVGGRLPAFVHRMIARSVTARDPAVVLFTSGSEGTPKGVVLSHENIQANRYQLGARIDFNPSDIVFNALPVFHSFGLTAGLLLPLLSGVKTFLYPSPLHYRIVPELVYASNATVLFGTDTFLAGYARSAHPYDFYSVRYVFAGTEKLKEETRRIWSEKFGLRIFEGYGATETSPVLATNTPMHYRAGTVGRLLPGIRYKLVEVPGIARGGRLVVSGPNIMLGYLRAERPGEIDPPANGWYDTRDIVEVDEDGFIRITDRLSRFSKIGGEMVPHLKVEEAVSRVPGVQDCVVTSVADLQKGERLVAFYSGAEQTTPEAVWEALSRTSLPKLWLPKRDSLYRLKSLPMLATGKIDLRKVKLMAAARV